MTHHTCSLKYRSSLRIIRTAALICLSMAVAALALAGCQQKTLAPAPAPPSDTGSELPAVPEALTQELEARETLKAAVLAGYTFYKGTAVIEEDSIIKNETVRDTLRGSGKHHFTSDDVLVYDQKTDQVYLIARSMYYIGEDRFTFSDQPTGFVSQNVQTFSGENHEYYGTGLLVKRELSEASASAAEPVASDYELVFTGNPVRMRPVDKVILTSPPPVHTSWVTLNSPSTESRQIASMTNQPEEVPYETLNLIPNLPEISVNRTYNRGLDVYTQLSNGFYGHPSGNFECHYEKITYEEALALAEEIHEAREMQDTCEAMAQNLPEVWQETARLGNTLKGAADASGILNNRMAHYGLDTAVNSRDAKAVLQAADALVSDPEITHNATRLETVGDDASAGNSTGTGATPRSLEGFVLSAASEEGAGAQQKGLPAAYGTAFLELEKAFKAYEDAASSLSFQLSVLKSMAPITSGSDPDMLRPVLAGLQDAANALKTADTRAESILNSLQTVLGRLQQQENASTEKQFEYLSALFGLWSGAPGLDALPQFNLEAGTALPEGYPSTVVPLPKDALLVIAESVPDDSGQTTYNLTLKSSLTPSELAAYYKSALGSAGNLETSDLGGMTVFSGQRRGWAFSVMVTANSLGGNEASMAQISVMAE